MCSDFHPGLRDAPGSSNHQEQRSMQFFVMNSIPQLGSYFDSPFWRRMVLQTGQHEPAVRHAITAISALHEKFLAGVIDPSEPEDERTRFALEQCNKSIEYLVTPSVSFLLFLLLCARHPIYSIPPA